MMNDLSIQHLHHEIERNAYNAAFYEIGFRWHWDRDTYNQLLHQGSNAAERIRHYLETRQPHLLKAYDAAFLVGVIQDKKAECIQRANGPDAVASGFFDWSQALGCEIGA
jgi:hypothetical protein